MSSWQCFRAQKHSEAPMAKDAPVEGAPESGGVSLGKGAWDCDRKCKIPPEKEVHWALDVF